MRHALAELIEAAERYQAYHDQKFYADAVVKPTGLRPAIAKARAAQSAVGARTYWLIERGSPCEWWAGTDTAKHWTSDVSKVHPLLKFPTKEGAEYEADRIKYWPTVIGSELRITEHMDCAGPLAPRSATARVTLERISELWKQAMSEGAQHFVGFINRGLVPNFEHPENLTLPQRFAILLLAEMKA